MIFHWTDDLATDVPEIDAQHQELFGRVNGLLAACKLKKGKEEIGWFIGFLEQYVKEHFAGEERKMAASGYPGLALHAAEHREFTRKLLEIKQEFLEHGAGINVVLMAARASGDWLAEHIRKTDKAMAAHLRSSSAG